MEELATELATDEKDYCTIPQSGNCQVCLFFVVVKDKNLALLLNNLLIHGTFLCINVDSLK